MKLPEPMPPLATSANQAARKTQSPGQTLDSGVEPAGCCLEICEPILGCHCVAESPFC